MSKFYDSSVEIQITSNTNIDEFIQHTANTQPIWFVCSKCGAHEHLQSYVLRKRQHNPDTLLLCHACLLNYNAKYYKQSEPLNSEDIPLIQKPISAKQIIKFTCEICNNISFVQYRHFNNICEHCSRSIAAKNNCANPLVQTKRKQTTLERYGVDNINKNRDYMNAKWEAKYGPGIHGAMQIPEYQKKQEQTMFELYGGYTLASPILRPIVDQTIYERYGATNIRNSEYYKQLFELFKDEFYSNRKAIYWLDNMFFDSSWEVAYYIWLRDSLIPFEYHPIPGIRYISGSKQCTYYPDFYVDGNIIEIKGDQFYDSNGNFITETQQDKDKYQTMLDHNVIFFRKPDVMPYIKYVREKYGRHYFESIRVHYD